MLDEVKSVIDLIDLEKKRYSESLDLLNREHRIKLEHLKSKLLTTPHCKYNKGDYVEVVSGFGFTTIAGKIQDIIIDDNCNVKYRIRPIDSDAKEIVGEFNDLDHGTTNPVPEYAIGKIHDIRSYFRNLKKNTLREMLEDADSESRSYRDRIFDEYIKNNTTIRQGDLAEITTDLGIFEGTIHQIYVSEDEGKYGEIYFVVDTKDPKSISRFHHGTSLNVRKKEV